MTAKLTKSTELTELQSQALSLFESGKYLELIRLLESQPQQFPDKQILGLSTGGQPGTFGYRVDLTQWAVKESNNWNYPNQEVGTHWVTFTVGLKDLTLNLHGCISQSVNWINGDGKQQWVYSVDASKLDADKLVESAIAVAV